MPKANTLAQFGNIVRFMARRPGNALELGRKLLHRLRGSLTSFDQAEDLRWREAHSRSSADFAQVVEPVLWEEAQAFERALRARGKAVLAEVPVSFGTGGAFAFLYWLVRLTKPEIVVETGVAAGWTSTAVLAAMARNDHGHLYSSDFPYFRQADAERYIGVLVEQDLRDRWTLSTAGDAATLPRLAAELPAIDLVHYDSDKSVNGRNFGVPLLHRKVGAGGLVIVDDIANDGWFRSYVEGGKQTFAVLDRRFGIIGDLDALAGARSGR